ncbi:MAG: MarR family transcriptional regulator [Verrucomicrobia bacterium]|nr:MarR family transcriptional regulator [Verrucomicrobiota bacterium]
MNPKNNRGSVGAIVPGPDVNHRGFVDVQTRFAEIFGQLGAERTSQEEIFSILSELVADVMTKVPGNAPSAPEETDAEPSGAGEAILVDLTKVPSRFSVSAVLVLHHLRTSASQPACLGRRLQVSAAAMSGILDTLEAKGLIARLRDPYDRRKVQVELTQQGRQMVASMFSR